jgi:hypothetical protein
MLPPEQQAEELATERFNLRLKPSERRTLEQLAVELAVKARKPVTMTEAILHCVNTIAAAELPKASTGEPPLIFKP